MWNWNAFKECESEMLEVKITMKYSIIKINTCLKTLVARNV